MVILTMVDELEFRSKIQYIPDKLEPTVVLDHSLADIMSVI